MIYESLKLVEKGETIVRNIVLYSEIANPSVYICKKGEKQYDRIFYVKKGNFFLQNSGSGGKCVEAGKGSVIYLPYDVEYKSYWNTKSEVNMFLLTSYCLILTVIILICLTDMKKSRKIPAAD